MSDVATPALLRGAHPIGPGLRKAGFSADASRRFERLLARAAAALPAGSAQASRGAHAFVVPGRVEVLGKHTDYAGGRSLLVAIERGIAAVAVPREDARVRVVDAVTGDAVELTRGAGAAAAQPGDWRAYPAAVVRRVARDFPDARAGFELAFASDLPQAAGLASSSALVTALFLALAAVNRLPASERYRRHIGGDSDLAAYLAALESGRPYGALDADAGVGTRGGSGDHVAITMALPGEVLQYAFAPGRIERVVAVPAGHVFAVAASGVRAEKAGAARERYNRAASLMEQAAEVWRRATGYADHETLGHALAALGPPAADRIRAVLRDAPDVPVHPDAVARRAEQFLVETLDLVPAAGDALAAGDVARFGAVVDRSQAFAEQLLENQVPETMHLARSARALGAAAASSFGAGFGGSVWALVPHETGPEFLDRWRGDYLAEFPARADGAEFFLTRAGPCAQRLL